jgi:hypothetical protein
MLSLGRMADRPPRRHFAVALTRVKGGWRVEHVSEHPSRGEAEKQSLTLLGRYGDAEAITLERDLAEGEVLKAADVGR